MTKDLRPYLFSLKPQAFNCGSTLGRRFPLDSDEDAVYQDIFDPYLIDREKIILSKAFRRLADKTQVFPNHRDNGHVRNRRVHTDEVAVLAMQITGILGLNTCLAEACALGHDLGHTPFGHLGEMVISQISGREFRHEVMSVVVAQKVERGGKGLNLSYETLSGILAHSRGTGEVRVDKNVPLEHSVVMLADKLSYIFSDLNDALRLGFYKEKDLPSELFALGHNQRERWQNCVYAIVKESSEERRISFEKSEVAEQFHSLRKWAFEKFYPDVNRDYSRQQAIDDLNAVYQFFSDKLGLFAHDPLLSLALLTDSEARSIAKFSKNPTVKDIAGLERFSFQEILRRFPLGYKINIFDPDLRAKDFQNQ